eukprot:2207332-Amphidinium_carterae.1
MAVEFDGNHPKHSKTLKRNTQDVDGTEVLPPRELSHAGAFETLVSATDEKQLKESSHTPNNNGKVSIAAF